MFFSLYVVFGSPPSHHSLRLLLSFIRPDIVENTNRRNETRTDRVIANFSKIVVIGYRALRPITINGNVADTLLSLQRLKIVKNNWFRGFFSSVFEIKRITWSYTVSPHGSFRTYRLDTTTVHENRRPSRFFYYDNGPFDSRWTIFDEREQCFTMKRIFYFCRNVFLTSRLRISNSRGSYTDVNSVLTRQNKYPSFK